MTSPSPVGTHNTRERERERESEGTEEPITGSAAREGPGQRTGFVHRLAQVNSSLSILETARHYEAVINAKLSFRAYLAATTSDHPKLLRALTYKPATNLQF